MNTQKRDTFRSKFGVLAAAAGSAIGLGNIWKFPYITGQNGGAAFLFVYLGFIVLIGVPIMLSEFIIGRKSQANAYGAFKRLGANGLWRHIGILGVLAAFMILSFYGVVAGWSLRYITYAIQNSSNLTPEQIAESFNSFITNPTQPIIYQLSVMLITGAILIFGVQKGIENTSKILMPIMLIIVVILDIKSITLEGATEGLDFLFNPDFSKLTFHGVLIALGHAFFSLSLGMGCLITYGSYINRDNNLLSTAVNVSVADTLIAILASIAIIPAVFAFGLEPSQGPGLIFITLPNVFQQMQGGLFFSILFFILLTIAALTSAISIMEVSVAFFHEELKIKRRISVILVTALTSMLGVICSLSLGIYSDYTCFGKNIFDLMDFISSNILLPCGGCLISLFVGWKMGQKMVEKELEHGSTVKIWFLKTFIFIVKFVAPIAILIVFVSGLI